MKQVHSIKDVSFLLMEIIKNIKSKTQLSIVIPHIKEQQNMKQKLLIMMSSGIGVEE